MLELRPYQQQVIDAAREQVRAGLARVLCVVPTGGGKTPLEVVALDTATRAGRPGAILTHRRELVRQISVTAAEHGLRHRIVAPRETVRECIEAHEERFGYSLVADTATAAIGSVQSALAQGLSDLALLIVDESHHCTANTYRRVAEASPGAVLLGFTATPTRLSGAGLDTAFDALVEGPSLSWLIEHGFLVGVDAYAPVVPDLSGTRTSGGDYQASALSEQLERGAVVENAVGHWHRIAGDRQTFAFGCSVRHAQMLADEAAAGGVEAYVLHGQMRSGERRELIRGFEAGQVQMLASCDLIGEGLDIRGGSAVLECRPTKSLALYMQHVGRAMRSAPGKDRAVLVDAAGNTARHGHPTEDRRWSLTEGAKADRRRREEAAESQPYPVRYCPSCYYVHPPAPACPLCGHEYDGQERVPEAFEAELEKIRPKRRQPELTDPQKSAKETQRKRACRTGDIEAVKEWARHWRHMEGKAVDDATVRGHAYKVLTEYNRKRYGTATATPAPKRVRVG
jgi:superfamily II DNA or RNA helicase